MARAHSLLSMAAVWVLGAISVSTTPTTTQLFSIRPLPNLTPSKISLNPTGGSIRIPAANCGLYGLRPTSYRIPQSGVLAPHLGSGYISGVVGPLSSSLEGLKLFMRTVIGAKPWTRDPSLVPIPWKEGKEGGDGGDRCWDRKEGRDRGKGRSLRVGVMYSDELVTPHPPIQRALREVVRKMEGIEGVELIEWHAWNHDLAWEFCVRLAPSQFPPSSSISLFIFRPLPCPHPFPLFTKQKAS